MDGYRIVIADDHPLFRQGLTRIIDGVSDLEVVGEAGNGSELLELLAATSPRLVVLDLSMPGLHGLEAIRLTRQEFPEVKMLVLTMHREYLPEALAAGAAGYLVKEDAARELFLALESIRQGEIYVSRRLREQGRGAPAGPRALTRREGEIMQHIVRGSSSRAISELLSLSVRTVEAHRAAILHKLNLKNTAELVRYALENGYLGGAPPAA